MSTPPDALYNKASQKELAGDLDDAFALYVQATQSYLHLSRTAKLNHERDQYKSSASRCLERAERIKATKRDLALVQKDRLSKESQHYALSKSGSSNGIRVPLWKDSPSPTLVATYTDPDGLLSLSSEQSRKFKTWTRCSALMPEPVIFSPRLRPGDLLQGNPTDCSLIASLAVCLQHHLSFGSKLGISSLYPHGADGLPTLSTNGMYRAKLYFNGTEREIVIDDLLPEELDGTLACAGTRHNDHLWPSLVEKAYLKLNGGYDFAGSNSSVDIHVLTGWIPEYISFQRHGLRRMELWRRIYDGFTTGKCVMTLNTPQSVAPFGLIANHSYAILDLSDDSQGRRILSMLDSAPRVEATSEVEVATRIIQLDWEDACDQFASVCLNWDPAIFAHSFTLHSTWAAGSRGKATDHRYRLKASGSAPAPVPGPSSTSTSSHVTPDRSSLSSTVWCLLIRHTRTKEDNEDFIALHSFNSYGGEGGNERSTLKEAYSDGSHCLTTLTTDMDAKGVTIAASRYASGDQECGYSLFIYSSSAVHLEDASTALPYSKEVNGSLSSRNSGGNSMHPTYMINPQYSLVVHPPRRTATSPVHTNHVRLVLHGDKDAPLNVKVLWSSGGRVTDVSQGDIALDSGAYNYGFNYAAGQLRPGIYTIVISAFDPGTSTPFSLSIESMGNVDLSPIPSEGAGTFSKTVKGVWEDARSPSYELAVPQRTELQIRLQWNDAGNRVPLKLMLHVDEASSHSTLGPPVTTTGGWSDAISGVLTERRTCEPGRYIAVPLASSREGLGKRFSLILYSSACPVTVKLR